MLFNSYEFIFYFLPIVFIFYFILGALNLKLISKLWLIAASLFFYSWWNVVYLPLIIGSLIFNFLIGSYVGKDISLTKKKTTLTFGIVGNVLFLGYFKYYDFFIENFNTVFRVELPLLYLALPLAISFFTFQQIAYIVDSYRGETRKYSFVNYSLFVTFFPQLIAGPIVHHKEMLPQFKGATKININNITLGIYIFFIGLFKKVIIADTFAKWATKGFDRAESLSVIDGWITSLSYTFQLYFDFSGYCDMAIGAALLFNIRLPINFNSPYKALNIQDFWRRWHITLSRFLTQYIYIPLGGNRLGDRRTYINILIIFLISGLWHGAGWTFVFWGLLHGLATVINRFWKTTFNIKMNKFLAWFITFNFVNIAWVFFRAQTWADAMKVLSGMFGLNGIALPNGIYSILNRFAPIANVIDNEFLYTSVTTVLISFCIIVSLWFTVRLKNSVEMIETFNPSVRQAFFLAIITLVSLFFLNRVSEFLYFNF